MNSRRKFLFQGSLAATALMVAKPYNALANYSSPLLQGGFNYNNITFLHTAGESLAVATQVKKIAGKTASIILHHSNKNEQAINCDASLGSISENEDGGYKIINKENICVGIITATAGEQGAINRVNNLSAFLKKEKNCSLVVCVSALGYKNKTGIDDLTLASESENLDIIIGKYTSTSPNRPMIARSKKKAEVIIQHTEENADALGKIKIGLDNYGNKYHVSF